MTGVANFDAWLRLPDAASLDRFEPSALATGPGDAAVVASIKAGRVFTCLLAEDPLLRAVKLEWVLDVVADTPTRFVRVSNPLRAKLTIERILIQVAGSEADASIERDPVLLNAILATQSDKGRLLVVIEQPETIDAESMHVLQAMGAHCAQAHPGIQFLFVGQPAFAAALTPDEHPSVAERRRLHFVPPLLLVLLVAVVAVAVNFPR